MTNVKRIDSSDTNVSKYIFDWGNAVAEAVLYRYGDYETRTVICCSTQSGCPVGCRFCGAGDNFVRNLGFGEIIEQVEHLFADRGIEPRKVKRGQIMFMSMGEPLLNFRNLEIAIHGLHERYPNFALLISTSGPDVDYEQVNAMSKTCPAVGLQFSIHESTDEARNKLIPFERKLSLLDISRAGTNWHFAVEQKRRPFFNYCAHPENTSDADADRLRALFDPRIWNATISVICEREEHVAAANERQRDLATGFASKLLERGFSTRCFNPGGQDDIGGGCGQLWFVQGWMKAHPDLTHPSVGSGLPSVHTPRPA